jgi:hypothetical protein
LTDHGGVAAYNSCADRTCLDNPVNTSNRSRDYVLAAGNSTGDPYRFTPRVVEVADNSTCSGARRLELGQREWGYGGTGGENRGSCSLVFAEGFTLWYSATIPAGTTYELQVERMEGPDINVEVLDAGCAGFCSESWDAYFHAGMDPVVPIVNDTNGPRDVMIAITPDGAFARPPGYFSMTLVESASSDSDNAVTAQ